MPYCYLITEQELTCSSNIIKIAIISHNRQIKLDNIKNGDFSGLDEVTELKKNIIIEKQIIYLNNLIFNNLVRIYRLSQNKNIVVYWEGNYVFGIIDDNIISLGETETFANNRIFFSKVGIYI